MRFTRALMPMLVTLALGAAPAAAKTAPADDGGVPVSSAPTSTTPTSTTPAAPASTTPASTTPATTAPAPTTTDPTAAPATTAPSGGAGLGAPTPTASTPAQPTVPGYTAKIIHGIAYAPSLAPAPVQEAIWAGNSIRRKPYVYGGGHSLTFVARGYDCSGAVSYLLHAAGLLTKPMDSSDLMSWGSQGFGEWITVFTDPAHAFIEIAGIRFDTSAEDDPNPPPGSGPRWRPLYAHPRGFLARHPLGY